MSPSLLDVLSQHPLALVAVCATLGLLIGSFLNVVILRLPRMLELAWIREARDTLQLPERPVPMLSLSRPPSRCEGCGARVKPWQNVPVLSWLWLRGRCASCARSISVQYPVVELLTAVLFAVCAWRFGLSIQLIAALGLTAALIALAVIDARTQLLPDALTLPLLWAGIALSLVPVFADVTTAVIGAMAGYLSLWLVFHLFRLVTGKEGMGRGDFKLLAALGAWLGWTALPTTLLMASASGAVIGLSLLAMGKLSRGTPMAFGPYLAIAGWIVMIAGDALGVPTRMP